MSYKAKEDSLSKQKIVIKNLHFLQWNKFVGFRADNYKAGNPLGK